MWSDDDWAKKDDTKYGGYGDEIRFMPITEDNEDHVEEYADGVRGILYGYAECHGCNWRVALTWADMVELQAEFAKACER